MNHYFLCFRLSQKISDVFFPLRRLLLCALDENKEKTKQTEVESGRNNLRNVIIPSESETYTLKSVDKNLKPRKNLIHASYHKSTGRLSLIVRLVSLEVILGKEVFCMFCSMGLTPGKNRSR